MQLVTADSIYIFGETWIYWLYLPAAIYDRNDIVNNANAAFGSIVSTVKEMQPYIKK